MICQECDSTLIEKDGLVVPCEICIREAYTNGHDAGYADGYDEGYDKGYA